MEIWKQTQYINYEVSNQGNVRNTKTGLVLTNSLSKSNNYYKVTLSVGMKGSRKSLPIEVHRLVAEAFVLKPSSSKSLVVDHIDNNKHNNEESNLQWLTQSDNIHKAKRNNKRTKFSEEQKQEIKDVYASGQYSLIKLTQYFNTKFNVTASRNTYTNIVK